MGMMVSARKGLLLLSTILLPAYAFGLAEDQPPRATDSKSSATSPEDGVKTATPTIEKKNGRTSALTMDTLKWPPGAIFVIVEQMGGLPPVPGAIIMFPEDYQKWLDQFEQLKRQATRTDKLEAPSTCKLSGRVDGDLAYLHAVFDFKTDRDKVLINLGCKRGRATDARLDGQIPWIQEGENGLVIQADKAGLHQASLDLLVPLSAKKTAKGADRGLDLDLPRAAITRLEQLDLPAAVTEVRMGTEARTLHPRAVNARWSRLESEPVVPLHHLELAWKGSPGELAKGPPVVAANGQIVVRVNETQVATQAELRLTVLRGETAQWQIQVPLPPEAALEIKPHVQDEARIQSIERSPDKQRPTWTIRLKEPSAEPLRVTVQARQPWSGGAVPIGPFIVPRAVSQNGDIEVRAADDLRLRYQLRSEVSQREISEAQRGEEVRAAFTYWNVPAANAVQPIPPLLSLQVEAARGTVETRVTHALRLVEAAGGGTSQWQILTKLDVMPVRTPVDRVELFYPQEYKFLRLGETEPADIVESVDEDSANQLLLVRLAQRQRRRFSVLLEGTYPQPAGQQTASLALPRPLAWSVERRVQQGERPVPSVVHLPMEDRGGQVSVVLPEGQELTSRQFRINPAALLRGAVPPRIGPLPTKAEKQEYFWQAEPSPSSVELAWRPYRPELAVDSVVDVMLVEGRQALVEERLRFHFSQAPPSRVQLHVPPGLRSPVRIAAGGTSASGDSKIGESWPVLFTAPAGNEHEMILTYSLPLAPAASSGNPRQTAARRLVVPLIQAVQATRGETRVRIWSDSAEQVSVAAGRWEELPTEVTERKSLPILVLRGTQEMPLALQVATAPYASLSTAVVDRVLARVILTEGGSQSYRVRFRLNKLSARHLDLLLPVPLTSANLQLELDGKVPPLQLVDETGRAVEFGSLVRLRIEPDLYHKPVVLDVNYQISPGRLEQHGALESVLQPPQLQGTVLLGRTRWHVEAPPGWMPLYPKGGFSVEQRWGLAGWLLAPRPALSNQELEQWLAEPEPAAPNADREPSLLCWQTKPGPLYLIQVPQQLWLLGCSLFGLAVGLGLLFLPLSRALFWSCLGGLVLAIVVPGFLWPGTLPWIVYGCEPGALFVLLVVGLQWMLHQRYRRQVVFMPGFTRMKPGSSLARAANNNRPREQTTVDEPLAKRGSSVSSEVRPRPNGT
jgi:hypothetical protein